MKKRGLVDIPSPFYRAKVTEVNIEKNKYGAVRVFIPDLMVDGIDKDWAGNGSSSENYCECQDDDLCMDKKFGWVDQNGNPVFDESDYYQNPVNPKSYLGYDEYGNTYEKFLFGVDGETKAGEEPKDEPYGIIAYPANSPIGGYNEEDPCSHYQTTVYTPLKGEWLWVFFEGNNTSHCFYFAAFKYKHATLPCENLGLREPNRSYTLLKTKMGRSIVVCDSRDQQRIEIMGKKRFLPSRAGGSNNPRGDLWSTYAIDEWKDNCEDGQDPVDPPKIKNKPYRIENPATGELEEHNTTILFGCQAFEISQGAQDWLDAEEKTLQQFLDENQMTVEDFIGDLIDIPGNSTTILFDERKGTEKVLIRTLYGDFIHVDIDERSLQAEFKNDINIKCGGDLSFDVGGDFHLQCENNYQTSFGCTSIIADLYIDIASQYSFNYCWPYMNYMLGPRANPKQPEGKRNT
jgi:hypothetical protein